MTVFRVPIGSSVSLVDAADPEEARAYVAQELGYRNKPYLVRDLVIREATDAEIGLHKLLGGKVAKGQDRPRPHEEDGTMSEPTEAAIEAAYQRILADWHGYIDIKVGEFAPDDDQAQLRDLISLVLAEPADEPTEADPHPDGLPEDLYVDIESTIHQHCGHDGQSDEANDWVTDLMAALTPLIVRALVGGRSAAPTREQEDQRLADAQQHNETLKGERDEARAVVVEARDILDALIEWFGAPNWAGPDLPVELGRRIATLLGPRSAMDRVRAPWALLSRSAAEPPATIDGRDHTTDAQTVIAAYLRTADLPAMRGTWAAMCEDVAAEILSELRAAGLVYDGVAAEPPEEART